MAGTSAEDARMQQLILAAVKAANSEQTRELKESLKAEMRQQVQEAVQEAVSAIKAESDAKHEASSAELASLRAQVSELTAIVASLKATSPQPGDTTKPSPYDPAPPSGAGPSVYPPSTPAAAATPHQPSGAQTPYTTGAAPPDAYIPLGEQVDRAMRECNMKVWIQNPTVPTPESLMEQLNTIPQLHLAAQATLSGPLPDDFIVSCKKVADGRQGVNSLYVVKCKTQKIRDIIVRNRQPVKARLDLLLHEDLTNSQAKIKSSYEPVNNQLRDIGVGVYEWRAEHPVYILVDGTYRAVHSVEEARILLATTPRGKPLKSKPQPNYQKRSRDEDMADADTPRTAAAPQGSSGADE